MNITAVITTCDRLQQLKKAVESVENQTLSPDELIIIDDNSCDQTQEYCENLQEISKIPVIYLRNDFRAGSNLCRNLAIERANGEYIAFLDDDDEWLPEKLQIQYETAKKEKADLVYTGVETVDSNGKKISRHFHRKPALFPPKIAILTLNYPGTTSCLMLKTELLRKISGFNPDYSSLQDYELSIRLIRAGASVAGVEKILVKYGFPSSSSIVASPKKFFDAALKLLKNSPKRYVFFQLYGLTRLIMSRMKYKSFRNNLFRKEKF